MKRADVVIYHRECPDGYSAAFVLYAGGLIGKSTVIIPDVPSAHSAPKLNVRGHVILVDVAYKASVIQDIIDQSESVIYIDHHRTHIEDILQLAETNSKLTVIFDESECGSTLAWRYCFPDQRVPMYLKLIRDNDIGIWKIVDTRPFITAFETEINMEPTVSALKKVKSLLTLEGLKDILVRGRLYYRYRDLMVGRAMKYSTKMTWGKYRVAFINIAGAIASETATRLAREDASIDFVVAYHYNISKRTFIYSMRSKSVDVESIARKRGGGGHEYAAAFQSTAAPDALVEEDQTGGDSNKLKICSEQESLPCKHTHTLFYGQFESKLNPGKLIEK